MSGLPRRFAARNDNGKKAWEYIFLAKKESARYYTTWAAFGNAYVVGRAMWGGDDDSFDNMMDTVENLLRDEESPWKRMPL